MFAAAGITGRLNALVGPASLVENVGALGFANFLADESVEPPSQSQRDKRRRQSHEAVISGEQVNDQVRIPVQNSHPFQCKPYHLFQLKPYQRSSPNQATVPIPTLPVIPVRTLPIAAADNLPFRWTGDFE